MVLSVCRISENFHPYQGGAERSAHLYSYYLSKAGIKNIVLTSALPGTKKREKVNDNFEIYRFDGVYSSYPRSPIPKLNFLKRAKKIIDKQKLDLIHVHHFDSVFNPWYLKKLTGLPLIYHQHDYTRICSALDNKLIYNDEVCFEKFSFTKCIKCLKNRGHYSFESFLNVFNNRIGLKYLESADRIICVSEFVKNVSSKILPSKNISKVYNMADPNLIDLSKKISSEDDSKKIVLFLGRWIRGKGIETLVEAAERIVKSDSSVKFKMLGAGPLKKEIIEEINKKRLNENILILGKKVGMDLWEQYANSSLVVVPSTSPEPLSRVILESYSFKKPVIASKTGGSPELVKNGETGLFFTPGDSEELEDALCNLLYDKNSARSMGELGHETLEDFLPDRIIPKVIEIYEETIN